MKSRRKATLITAALALVVLAVATVVWLAHGGLEQPLVPSCTEPRSEWSDLRRPLIQTRWKQDGPYAAMSPGRDLLGCWSVAFAQVLAYHRLPPTGRVAYTTRGGKVINESFEDPVAWERIVPEIGAATGPENSLQTAKYCYHAAVVVQKDFGRGEYMDIGRVPGEIAEHYGCKVERIDSGLEAAVRSELSASRPLIAYFDDILGVNDSLGFHLVRIGHAAVVDGMANAAGSLAVHVNFGWGGASDGWYDFQKLAQQRELLYVFRIVR